MRKVTGNITTIANTDYANSKIEFILCDYYGRKTNAIDDNGQIATSKTISTDEAGYFEIELYETELSPVPIYYKMSFNDPSIEDIKLFVQKGKEDIDFLKLLLPIPNFEMWYKQQNQKIVFDDMIVSLFDRFFVNENIFTNSFEKKILDEFVRYADKIRDTELMRKLDKFLGEINEWKQ